MTANHNIGENVTVRENENGEAEIVHNPSGQTARVTGDGLVSQAHSTEELKNAADHIVGDTETLETVLNTDLADGDTVWVGSGTYETMNLEPSANDVTLVGPRDAVLLLDSAAETNPGATDTPRDNLISLKGLSGWQILGLTFDGNSANLTAYDANQEDAMNGLALANCDDITVSRCNFRDVRQNALLVTAGTRNCRIVNNSIENSRTPILSYNIAFEEEAEASPHHNTFHGNLIEGTIADMTEGNPIGIYCSGGTHSSIIEANTILGMGELQRGIQILNTYNTTATANQIQNTTARGIAFSAGASNNGVGFNQINCPNARPLYAEDNGPHDNNIVAFNSIEGAGMNGIDLRNGTGWQVVGNAIINPDQRAFNVQGNVGDGVFSLNTITGPGQDTANRAISIDQGTWHIGVNAINDTLATLNVSIGVNAGASDVGIERQVILAGPQDIADSGTRTVINGWGTNAGDPSVEGDWNGNGREGVNVYDETNGVKYSYAAGDWR